MAVPTRHELIRTTRITRDITGLLFRGRPHVNDQIMSDLTDVSETVFDLDQIQAHRARTIVQIDLLLERPITVAAPLNVMRDGHAHEPSWFC